MILIRPRGLRHRLGTSTVLSCTAFAWWQLSARLWLRPQLGFLRGWGWGRARAHTHTHTHSHPTFLLFEMMQKNQGVTSLLPPCLLASVKELPFRFHVDSQSRNPHRRFIPWLAGGLLQGLFQCARVVWHSILSAPNACTGSTVPRASAPVPSSLDLETVSYQRTSWRGSEVACLALSHVKWSSGKGTPEEARLACAFAEPTGGTSQGRAETVLPLLQLPCHRGCRAVWHLGRGVHPL